MLIQYIIIFLHALVCHGMGSSALESLNPSSSSSSSLEILETLSSQDGRLTSSEVVSRFDSGESSNHPSKSSSSTTDKGKKKPDALTSFLNAIKGHDTLLILGLSLYSCEMI